MGGAQMFEKKINQLSWIEKSNAIIDSIADDFDCVCYVDLTPKSLDEEVDIFQPVSCGSCPRVAR